MEQKYNTSTLGQEMEQLRKFFDQKGEFVTFSKGELLECEGEPAKWIAYVERERYDLLMQRCPGIVNELPLNAIASFLNITPKTISMLRRDITLGK